MGRNGALGVVVLGLLGCAGTHSAKKDATEVTLSGPVGGRYVDPELGFEIVRPNGAWQLDATDEVSPEGLAVPIVLRHPETGAQVILQVAPAVASPTRFAERLNQGLRNQPGFNSSEPEPLSISDDAVGFRFEMGEMVRGRVAVREGSPGRVFMMMATWPSNAPDSISQGVDAIFGSLQPLPPG